MRSLLVPLCLLGLGGCDVVFDLEGDVLAGDAGGDERPGSDAMPDGPAPCPNVDPCGQSITHDEDGDCTADPCDLCPHLPGVDTDEDGDRIGDQCDISKFVPSEARFESFETTTVMSFIPAASWTVVGDTLQAAAPTLLRYAVHPVPNAFPYEIRTRVEMPGTTVTRGIAFNLDNATAPISGYVVTVTRDGSVGNTVAVYTMESGVLSMVANTEAVPGDVIDLQIFVGAQLAVTTINPMDETDKIGPLFVTPDNDKNPVGGGTFDGLVTDGPGPRFAYWYRSQNGDF